MKLLNKLGIAAGLAISLSVVGVNQAEAASFDLTFTGTNTSATGTGTVTFDDALLAPNTFIFGQLTELTAFEANFTDLPTDPSFTSFNLSNLAGWVFTTDSNASITDINFFGNGNNADDYSVEGIAPFTLALSNANNFVDIFTISATPEVTPPVSVPEPSSALGIALFLTLFGAKGILKSKSKEKQLILSHSKA